ncbi:hypothetical protein EVAR_19298_1 [Eumeta japonica]|uniref:Uncharacterized protein n=1 Tax=Eumeta variegata TaxID=151549 RepID=A0A4C1UEM7_EUMVA|nr:hypothetical protein EVAR_19298_1 [Eumeta japonica]
MEDGALSPTPKKERGIIGKERELDAGRRTRYVVGVRGVQEGREGGALRIPALINRLVEPACHTLSKALATSKKTATVLFGFKAFQDIFY